MIKNKRKPITVIALLLVVMSVMAVFIPSASALTFIGSGTGQSGGSAKPSSGTGYSLQYTEYCSGYRLSYVNKNGVKYSKGVIDVIDPSDWNDYVGRTKLATKYTKKELINLYNNGTGFSISTTTGTPSNTYEEGVDISFNSNAPMYFAFSTMPTRLDTWQKNTSNLDKVLGKMDSSYTVAKMSPADMILIEPIILCQFNGINYALTLTELWMLAGSTFGYSTAALYGGNTGTYNRIAYRTNGTFPNSIYTPNGKGLWTNASALSVPTTANSQVGPTFAKLITYGYGVAICRKGDNMAWSICYDCNGSSPTINTAKGYKLGQYNRICTTTYANKTIWGTPNVFYQSVGIDGSFTAPTIESFGITPPTGYRFSHWKRSTNKTLYGGTNYKLTNIFDDSDLNSYSELWLSAVFVPNNYNATIAHWCGGFVGDGTNGNKTALKLATTSKSYTYNSTLSFLSSDKIAAANLPNGVQSNGNNIGSSSFEGAWKTYEMPKYFYNIKQISPYVETYYSLINYSITYDLDGGTLAKSNPSTYNVVYGAKFANAPTKPGYTFAGWSYTKGGSSKITGINESALPGSAFTNDTGLSGGAFYNAVKNRTTGNKTVYATWKVNTVSFSHWLWGFNGKGTNGNKDAILLTTTQRNYGNTLTVTASDRLSQLPNGVVAKNTFGSDSFEGVWKGYSYPKTFNNLNANSSVECDYDLVNYTITYDLDGGTLATPNPSTYNVVYGAKFTNKPTKSGSNFLGWTIDGTNIVTGINETALPNSVFVNNAGTSGGALFNALKNRTTGNRTVKALWSTNNYTVTFKTEDGTTLQSTAYAYGSTPKYYGTTPTKSASSQYTYSFGGWSKSMNSTGTVLSALPTVTGNATYYAHFNKTERSYTATFIPNGGKFSDGTMGNKIINYKMSEKLSAPNISRTGYTFKGWKLTTSVGNWSAQTYPQTLANVTGKYGNVTFTAQWELNINLSLEPIIPNAPYRENTTVITSFNIINSNSVDCLPGDEIKVVFKVYNGSNLIKTETKTRVVVPKNEKNILYFKWNVPQNVSASVLVTAEISDKNGNVLYTTSKSYSTCKYSIYATPDTQYEISAPDGYRVPTVPSQATNKSTWSEWKYENGTFVKINYGVEINASVPVITPAASANAVKLSGVWTMKSGYGVGISQENGTSGITGYSVPTSEQYTLPQYAIALFPEFMYSNTQNNSRTLELVSGKWVFRNNSDYGRVHFTPLWFPDGNYIVSTIVSDMWTPTGMLSQRQNTNKVIISGSAYDDWYIS